MEVRKLIQVELDENETDTLCSIIEDCQKKMYLNISVDRDLVVYLKQRKKKLNFNIEEQMLQDFIKFLSSVEESGFKIGFSKAFNNNQIELVRELLDNLVEE